MDRYKHTGSYGTPLSLYNPSRASFFSSFDSIIAKTIKVPPRRFYGLGK